MDDEALRAMLIEYMGRGFLENIIAMMKQDPALTRLIPALMGDDAIVVRLGTTALIEELAKGHREALAAAVPGLLALLGHENPTIRGDAANVLGIIGDRTAREGLQTLLGDANASVREIAAEALREIEEKV